jgi:N-formylglutamate amidohydrolase
MAFYGRDAHVHAVMIEVNRGLYMDEQTGARLGQFKELRRRLVAVLE